MSAYFLHNFERVFWFPRNLTMIFRNYVEIEADSYVNLTFGAPLMNYKENNTSFDLNLIIFSVIFSCVQC